MPYQIKNGIIYSGNAVTLTQAQYDALTTAEKNNGTVYYIYDSDAMIEAQEVGLDGGNVETLAGSVATFETSPSTAVHAEGEYILYQAQLYKVTSAIAVGEDLTVGSNIEATNLGNELNAGLIDGMGAKLLWSGNFTGSGSITVNGLSDWLVVAYSSYESDLYMLVGSPSRGGTLYGVYDSASITTTAYRFSQNGDTISVNSNDRGIYMEGTTTYSGGTNNHIRHIYGLIKKPTQ